MAFMAISIDVANGLALADHIGARLSINIFRERRHELPNVDDDLHDLGVDEALEDGCVLFLHRVL